MNREIKFRLFDKVNNNMVYPSEKIYINMFGKIVLESIYNGEIIEANTDEYVLMQYTGLIDKNGKEIYEGDIIKAESRLWQVDFKDGCFVGVDFKNVAWDELVNIGYGETEVIGNVFEDSELLEV